MLSLAGYEVRPAARPEVALASALDAPPDLAVLDVRMPGMDGFELCRRLKGDPRTAAVPVIFISAAHDEAVRLQGFDVGGVDFVSTPIEERLVLARVATHLRLARAQRDLEAERALLEQRVRERTARLQESETLARTLLNATFDLTHLLDADGTILDLNAAMADALGAPREALIGTCVFDRFTEHVAEHRKQLLRRTIEEQQPLRTVDVSQPGTVLDTAFYPVPAAAGQKRRVVVFSHDITERQRTEDALWERARSEERARAMFDQAAVGMAYVGPDGRFLRINRKFCDIVGYSECEMLERTFMDITHPEDVGMDGRALRRLVSGEIDTYGREKRYVCKDGTTIWAEVAVSLVRADSSTAPWLVTVVQDISARKRAEQAVLEYQRRLKELAAELSRTEQRERRNIAAELHDRVGQSLSAMRAELAAARKETSGPSVDARLEDVSNCLREAIRDTRNIMSSLSDPILDRLGLSAGISAWLREEIGARHGLDTRFSDDGEQKPLGAGRQQPAVPLRVRARHQRREACPGEPGLGQPPSQGSKPGNRHRGRRRGDGGRQAVRPDEGRRVRVVQRRGADGGHRWRAVDHDRARSRRPGHPNRPAGDLSRGPSGMYNSEALCPSAHLNRRRSSSSTTIPWCGRAFVRCSRASRGSRSWGRRATAKGLCSGSSRFGPMSWSWTCRCLA